MATRKNTKVEQKFTVKQIATDLAEMRGISVDQASKDVRARARRNYPTILKNQPELVKLRPVANDRSPHLPYNEANREFLLSPASRKVASA